MELRILYRCPSCDQKVIRNLADLAPGQHRDCRSCGTPVALTAESLSDLRQSLREAYQH